MIARGSSSSERIYIIHRRIMSDRYRYCRRTMPKIEGLQYDSLLELEVIGRG